MCISLPAKLISVTGSVATVDIAGSERHVLMAADARPGDWVLVYAQTAFLRIDEDQARETLALLAARQGGQA